MNFNSGAPLTFTTGVPVGTGDRTATMRDVSTPSESCRRPSRKISGIFRSLGIGIFYFNGYTQIVDPGIDGVTAANGLNTAYSNKAIVAPNGSVVLVNPQPGEVGSMGLATLKGPRSLSFDMNLMTGFDIIIQTSENASMNVNGLNTFGQITTAGAGQPVRPRHPR